MSPPGPFVLSGTRYVVLARTEEGFTLSQLDQADPISKRAVRCPAQTHVDGSVR